jgi:cobalt/nickel transport system ATP-binding protein
MGLFTVRQLSFRYGARNALENVDLNIAAGERVVLLGSNGSGKSTLLRLLDGLYLPSAGSIHFDGVELTEDRLADPKLSIAFRRRVGLLFQDPDVQLFNATVFDEIAFGPLQLGWTRDQVIAAVDEALKLFDIAELRDRAPYHLSGGEKKRVALASVLVVKPEVLLLDEPTAALDPKSQSQLIDFLQTLPAATTIITATHELSRMQDIAQTGCILQQGRILKHGSVTDILADSALLRRANLI